MAGMNIAISDCKNRRVDGKQGVFSLPRWLVQITCMTIIRVADRRQIVLNTNLFSSKRFWLLAVCLISAIGVLLVMQSNSVIAAQKSKGKGVDLAKAYKVHQKKCLRCHVSVADPEKPGRTRDDWHLIVNVMHDYGLDLTTNQSEQIIDLLYELRRGLEREAG